MLWGEMHGSPCLQLIVLERPISISLAGLTFPKTPGLAGDPRALIMWVVGLKSEAIRAVQLDATMAGVRARELDRSARRDLASLIRRQGLGVSGLDLWVPPEHFAAAAQVDRALAAVKGAIGLAADLASLTQCPEGRVVCMELPETTSGDVAGEIAEAALGAAVEVADFGLSRAKAAAGGPIGVGVDPAAMLAAGQDPAVEVPKLAATPIAARLCDWMGGGRYSVGKGKLDRLAYEATLATKGFSRPLVLDLRGLHDADAAARAAIGL